VAVVLYGCAMKSLTSMKGYKLQGFEKTAQEINHNLRKTSEVGISEYYTTRHLVIHTGQVVLLGQ
jgi:hypothetical protein